MKRRFKTIAAGALVACAMAGCSVHRSQLSERRDIVARSDQSVMLAKSTSPQQVSEKMGSIDLPFLGTLKVRVKPEEFRIPVPGSSPIPMTFKVARLPDGRFVNAEFNKPGAHRYWPTADVEESNLRITGQEITGLPKEDGTRMLPTVIQNLKAWIDLEKATHIDVEYVMLRGISGDPNARAVFMAAVYGVKQLEFGARLPDEERFKCIHYVFDESGSLLYGSN